MALWLGGVACVGLIDSFLETAARSKLASRDLEDGAAGRGSGFGT